MTPQDTTDSSSATSTQPKRCKHFQATLDLKWYSPFLAKIFKASPIPSWDEYQRLMNACQQGDRLMDPVAEWIMQNPKAHRKVFQDALDQGINGIDHAPEVLKQLFAQVDHRPTWVDPTHLEQAVQFAHRLGATHGYVLRDLSLMAGYLMPGFNQPLIATGALKQNASTRLAETTKWWIEITEPQGLERFHAGFKSTLYVRFIHALVRLHVRQKKEWDAATWGLPINQLDLMATNLAFSSVVLLGVRMLGIFPNRSEREAFLHFWRYVGWLMGVNEEWLIEDEKQGWRLIYLLQFMHPESDESTRALGQSLAQEPFEREFPYFKAWQQKFAYHQHLSITHYFIGNARMKKLGLAPPRFSWYPYYLIPKNFVTDQLSKHVPPLQRFFVQRGRKIQRSGLNLYGQKAKQLASMHQA